MGRDSLSKDGYKSSRDYRKRSPDSRHSRRSRSRSPLDRRNRSRSRDRNRRDRDKDNKRKRSSPTLNKKKSSRAEKIDLKSCQGINEDIAKLMGFSEFNTTKNKKVKDNVSGAVKINKPRKYRQYMNRKGGFNRPLDYVA